MKATTMLLRCRACGPDLAAQHGAQPVVLLAICCLLAALEVWCVAEALQGMEYGFALAHFG